MNSVWILPARRNHSWDGKLRKLPANTTFLNYFLNFFPIWIKHSLKFPGQLYGIGSLLLPYESRCQTQVVRLSVKVAIHPEPCHWLWICTLINSKNILSVLTHSSNSSNLETMCRLCIWKRMGIQISSECLLSMCEVLIYIINIVRMTAKVKQKHVTWYFDPFGTCQWKVVNDQRK